MKKEKWSLKKYGYLPIIISLCFLMILVGLGFCSSNRSLYLAPITEALGIKRSMFSISDSFRFVTTAIVNLFFGTLVSKFGTKKLIGAGFVSLILCMLCYAYTNHVWGFWIGSIFLGIGLSWTTTTMVGCVVNKWCKEKHGTIMGAVLAANGLGSALATQIVSPIIYEEGNAFGYRNAYKLIVVLLLITGGLIMLFYKEKPEEAGEKTAGKKHGGAKGGDVSLANGGIKQTSYFYLVAICIFMTGFVLQGIGGISSAHMKDVGLDAAYIATMVSFHSLALAGFKFLSGVLYDKFGLRVITTVCDVAAVVAILSLAFVTDTMYGKGLALVYAVISSLALPLETVMLPIFARSLFDKTSYNKILGIFVSVNTAGYALGSPVMNAVYDATGSYKSALLICCTVMIAITIGFQYIMKIAKEDKKA